MAEERDPAMSDPLDMLREWWSYEGDDVAEGLRQVERYCRTMEARAMTFSALLRSALHEFEMDLAPGAQVDDGSIIARIRKELG